MFHERRTKVVNQSSIFAVFECHVRNILGGRDIDGLGNARVMGWDDLSTISPINFVAVVLGGGCGWR